MAHSLNSETKKVGAGLSLGFQGQTTLRKFQIREHYIVELCLKTNKKLQTGRGVSVLEWLNAGTYNYVDYDQLNALCHLKLEKYIYI